MISQRRIPIQFQLNHWAERRKRKTERQFREIIMKEDTKDQESRERTLRSEKATQKFKEIQKTLDMDCPKWNLHFH